MNYQYKISYRRPGPVAKVVSLIVSVVALGFAAFLGIFVLAALAGMIVIGSTLFAIRIWWIKRQVERAVREGRSPGDVIPGEYIVIEEQKIDRPDV
jgi:UPF0716 family protein affecting phage T7 exclusion